MSAQSSPHNNAQIDPRRDALREWFAGVAGAIAFELTPASADASFRRYFRARLDSPLFGQQTLIVMDAPPDKENCTPFVQVDRLMRELNVNAPQIFEHNEAQGFMVLEDFGSTTYLTAINAGADANQLYLDAIDTLVRWQQGSRVGALPAYDDALLRYELMLFPDWFVARYKQHQLSDAERAMLERSFALLIASARAQTQVFVHRDYHSRNLMVTASNNPGVIDFQDAVYGPLTYDLLSLLRDAYIEWDEEQQLDWAIRYWERARKAGVAVPPGFDQFWRDFEWMGIQRHLKVAGIFARLAFRDGKTGYLNDLPLVMRYLRRACSRYSEFSPLLRLLDQLTDQKIETGYSF